MKAKEEDEEKAGERAQRGGLLRCAEGYFAGYVLVGALSLTLLKHRGGSSQCEGKQ